MSAQRNYPRALPSRLGAVLLLCAGAAPTATAAPEVSSGHVPSASVAVDYLYRGAELRGRSLGVRELLVRGEPTPWLTLWGGGQNIVAHGHTARFESYVSHYGARAALLGNRNSPQELAASYELFQTGLGKATDGDDYASYTAVQTQTFALSYHLHTGRFVPQLEVNASEVHGGTERGSVVGGTAGVGIPLGGSFRADVSGSLFGQSGAAGTSTRSVFSAGLTFAPLSWAQLELGATVAPHGFPIAGTPLTGLSSFLIYRPDGAAQELSDRAVGYGTLRLEISHQF